MLEQFDHDELLAFIEGELEPDDAARLEHELANSPRAAMLVERMRRDRELLRSEREPAMPRNFLPSIESRLARPMLMESLHEADEAEILEAFSGGHSAKPGAMRRQHRRNVLRRRLTKLGVAAGLVLVIGGGGWTLMVATNLIERSSEWVAALRSPTTDESDARDRAAAELALSAEHRDAEPDDFAWPPGAIVHHAPPGGTLRDLSHVVAREQPELPTHVKNEAPPLDVLLVIRTDDPGKVESALTGLITKLDAPVALVQNFSYDEAAQLAEAWVRSQAGRSRPGEVRPPSVAGVDGTAPQRGDRLSRLADDAQQQLRQMRGGLALDEVEQSRQLAGPREHAVSFAEQLDYSSRGATHTFTIPAGKLHDLLAELNRAADAEVVLTALPEPEEVDDIAAPMASEVWLAYRRELQLLLMRLDGVAEDALIHLPVRIERTPARR